jgi:hypothetical protein
MVSIAGVGSYARDVDCHEHQQANGADPPVSPVSRSRSEYAVSEAEYERCPKEVIQQSLDPLARLGVHARDQDKRRCCYTEADESERHP